MTQYEYYVLNRDQTEKVDWVNDILNEMGEKGWRLTLVSDWFFAFERPVESDGG